VRREIEVDVPIDEVWDAVRDFGALHERVASGFATETRVEGGDRVVTFFNGAVFRERLISSDDEGHRLAWTIVDGPWTHHNGSVELFADPAGRGLSGRRTCSCTTPPQTPRLWSSRLVG
jgi:uncharacterized membrane protein